MPSTPGTGRLSIVLVVLLGFLAAVIGDNIGFAIGRFGGRRLVERFGRYILLTPERLDKATGFFERRGAGIIIVARFVEGLRQANGIIAGTTGMHWARFLAFNAVGAALWVGCGRASATSRAPHHLDLQHRHPLQRDLRDRRRRGADRLHRVARPASKAERAERRSRTADTAERTSCAAQQALGARPARPCAGSSLGGGVGPGRARARRANRRIGGRAAACEPSRGRPADACRGRGRRARLRRRRRVAIGRGNRRGARVTPGDLGGELEQVGTGRRMPLSR